MRDNSTQENKFLITLSDLLRLVRVNKKLMISCILFLAFLGALYALTRQVEYRATGSFKEKNPKTVNINSNNVSSFMANMGLATPENEGIALFKSRRLMKEAVKRLNMQGFIYPISEKDTYLRRVKENLLVEWAYLSRSPFPAIKDWSKAIVLKDLEYLSEIPSSFRIKFHPDGKSYNVSDSSGYSVGQGQIGEPFITEQFRFILFQEKPLAGTIYELVFFPMNMILAAIEKNLQVDADKNDKNLLKFYFQHRDRRLACQYINTLMDCYKEYLQNNHDSQANFQLNYLYKRQNESENILADLMNKYAFSMSQDFSSMGFADSKKEMEFLASRQHIFKDKLHSNELEIKRLQNIQTGRCVYYDRYAPEGDSQIINRVLEEMRDLKQQRDSLELTLRENVFLEPQELDTVFQQHIQDLLQLQAYQKEIDKIIEDYSQQRPLDQDLTLFKDPRFLVKTWYEKLSAFNKNDEKKPNTSFIDYLGNLKRHFHVHEKILQQRLTHQQNKAKEFQGITFETTKELYFDYSKRVDVLESAIRHYTFLIQQIEDPSFEISSLSSILEDPVSREIIQQSGQLELALKDQNNRSYKEHDRLKDELQLKKNFLLLHLKQMIQLSNINQQIYKEKIYALQSFMLELIHQRISLLEKNLADYIDTRLENLKQEQKVVQQHMAELYQEMARLPEKWVSEQLIQQRVEMNQLIVEEIAKLVESRNIAHNLELIQSAPIDIADTSIHPQRSRFFLYSILGAFIGALFSVGFVISRALIRGLPASKNNLELNHQHVAGLINSNINALQDLRDQDLDTLRRLRTFFMESKNSLNKKSLLLIEGNGLDYSKELAQLFIKEGCKILILDVGFNKPLIFKEPGLLDYLEEKTEFPTIHSDPKGDFIEGGIMRFSSELLMTRRFRELIHNLEEKYDWIIAKTEAMPCSVQAQSLLALFSIISVTLDQETLEDLEPYIQAVNQQGKKISFVFTNPYKI